MSKCSTCDNNLPNDPATVIVEGYQMKVCGDCELLLNTITNRLEQEKDGGPVYLSEDDKSQN